MRLTEIDESETGALRAALTAEGLPTADLDVADRAFFAYSEAGVTQGFGGLEVYGGEALLRSVVVLPKFRRTGTGARLVRALIAEARDRGVRRLWLLTLTADAFFARAGFQRGSRSQAPEAVAASAEFKTLCPASAVCMWISTVARQ